MSPRLSMNRLGQMRRRVAGYLQKGGVIGVTLLRLLPIAPFMVINLALALLHVPFLVFIVATFLAILPGTIANCLLGFSLLEAWKNPDPHNLLAVGLSFLFWLVLVVGAHAANRFWRRQRRLPP